MVQTLQVRPEMETVQRWETPFRKHIRVRVLLERDCGDLFMSPFGWSFLLFHDPVALAAKTRIAESNGWLARSWRGQSAAAGRTYARLHPALNEFTAYCKGKAILGFIDIAGGYAEFTFPLNQLPSYWNKTLREWESKPDFEEAASLFVTAILSSTSRLKVS